MSSPLIKVFPDLEALSLAAARKFADLSRKAVNARGRFAVALSGGRTPRRTYELLARPEFRDNIPWEKVHIFWGDERCVPEDDPRSNQRLARKAWLDQVPIPPAQVHPVSFSESAIMGAERYESLLHSFFRENSGSFDLVFLGLGPDAHTASLFPGSKAVREQERWVVSVFDGPAEFDRITLTAPLINQAAVVVFLVAGKAKARALKAVLNGPKDSIHFPAQLIQPRKGKLYWFVDKDAANEK